jgi:hypothetical protein
MSEHQGLINILTQLDFPKPSYFKVLFLTLLVILSSCAGFGPTEPNQPYERDLPFSYSQLAESNPLLAREVAKLPEIIDGVSSSELRTLDELIAFYIANKTSFDEVFAEMYKVGIPEVRRYCTPLQALFWIVEDGKLKEQEHLLKDYSLDKLLKVAWDFSAKSEIDSLSISEAKAAEIIASIDKNVIWYAKNQKSAKDTLILCYTRTPDAIPTQHLKFIESIPEVKMGNKIFDKNQSRWNEPDVIIDRLNAPELLDYYIDKNIRYGFIPNHIQPASYTIRKKSGGCASVAKLGQVALSRAGYKVTARIIGSGSPSDWHVGLVAELEDGTYLMAVNFKNSNVMTGPHYTMREADQALGYSPSKNLRGTFNFDWNHFRDYIAAD